MYCVSVSIRYADLSPQCRTVCRKAMHSFMICNLASFFSSVGCIFVPYVSVYDTYILFEKETKGVFKLPLDGTIAPLPSTSCCLTAHFRSFWCSVCAKDESTDKKSELAVANIPALIF